MWDFSSPARDQTCAPAVSGRVLNWKGGLAEGSPPGKSLNLYTYSFCFLVFSFKILAGILLYIVIYN